jgi:NADH-quinone oxidoreductase subunit I
MARKSATLQRKNGLPRSRRELASEEAWRFVRGKGVDFLASMENQQLKSYKTSSVSSRDRPKHKERDFRMKGLVKGLSYTVKNLTKQNVTTSYPDVPIQMPDRFRGIQKFYPEKCIVCNQCAQICPTDCIQLTGKPHPDPAKKGKIIDTYDINFEICILCDLCTEVCPTEAIVMTNQFELAEYSRDDLFKNLEWLDENDENVRKENKA